MVTVMDGPEEKDTENIILIIFLGLSMAFNGLLKLTEGVPNDSRIFFGKQKVSEGDARSLFVCCLFDLYPTPFPATHGSGQLLHLMAVHF